MAKHSCCVALNPFNTNVFAVFNCSSEASTEWTKANFDPEVHKPIPWYNRMCWYLLPEENSLIIFRFSRWSRKIRFSVLLPSRHKIYVHAPAQHAVPRHSKLYPFMNSLTFPGRLLLLCNRPKVLPERFLQCFRYEVWSVAYAKRMRLELPQRLHKSQWSGPASHRPHTWIRPGCCVRWIIPGLHA